MLLKFSLGVALVMAGSACFAQAPPESTVEATVRGRLSSYVEVFNQHDAAALAAYWTEDAVSVAEETGDRTVGKAALLKEFSDFFAANPNARLIGEVQSVRAIRPDVVCVEGETTVFAEGDEPVKSRFTALLVEDQGTWRISSSFERDLPVPQTAYEALRELEWLVGTWQDQAGDSEVITSVRWSSQRAFLIRSFRARFADEELIEGTQVIGWDPRSSQIRTWTFNSNGSFGEGTVARHDDSWSIKLMQVLSDGRVSTGTQVITRVDEATLTVETIGQTIDGVPVASSAPVTVVKVDDAMEATTGIDAVPQSGAAQ